MTSLTRRSALMAGAATLAAPMIARAQTEISEVRVAKQFGISYLPLIVMEQQQLIEKHARALGIANLRVSWPQFAGGAPINDALIGGNLEFAGGGVGPMVTLWARTRANLNVRAVACLNSMPLYLNTVNPAVQSIRDFTERDRIALPAVRVSIQAVTLAMACEQAFGAGQHGRLDNLQVSMSHPDAQVALLSGRSEVTAHFGSPPFQNQQLQDARVRRVLSSYDVLGGPATFNMMWTTARVRQQNPRVYRAFMMALDEANAFINGNKPGAAALFIQAENSRLSPDFVLGLLNDRDHVFTTTPQRVMAYAEFMHRVGIAPAKPDRWQDLFFEEMQSAQGS